VKLLEENMGQILQDTGIGRLSEENSNSWGNQRKNWQMKLYQKALMEG
jgi:hypothetical protein